MNQSWKRAPRLRLLKRMLYSGVARDRDQRAAHQPLSGTG
jgi:hypothetical protein